MPSSRRRDRLREILQNIERITLHVDGETAETFADNWTALDAVERCFQRITEATIKLGTEGKTLLPNQDLDGMRNFGNLLRHYYDVINPSDLWYYIEHDLPSLRSDCETALVTLSENPNSDD